MKNSLQLSTVVSWLLGLIILTLGVLNLILIHPVPGLIYILLSLIFFPPVEKLFRHRLGFSIPFPILVVLAVIIFWFTLGVSDLAEMYGL
ncbi:hypothetical protein [Salinimicrobium terrae]|uniref:hypothetical protein n=1 Tax=Salinimicrobium terrae TaxID=470866 RepID=UPI000407D719|nr:hypothetical protein [Salinimicrobium terrae]